MNSPSNSFTDETDAMLASNCSYCSKPLEVPWIRCVECSSPSVDICAHCFCNGEEFDKHQSDHSYRVVTLDFSLYESHWSASEELKLLDAVQDCGLGNWQAISKRIKTKSEAECQRHYLQCYVNVPQAPLPAFPDKSGHDNGAPVVFKLSDNPPRPMEGSSLWTDMGGYSAARCDFNTEHNNFVEMDVCSMTFGNDNQVWKEEDEVPISDRQLYTDINLAVLDVYRNCLLERQRRKKLIRDYGLVNMRKWFVFLRRRFDNVVSFDFLRPFMRLFPAYTFDKYLESLLYEKQLKHQISKLQNYRQNGVTVMRAARLFSQLKERRELERGKRHLLTDVLSHVKDESSCQSWLARQAALEGTRRADKLALPNAVRKAPPRLQIEGMIGYEKLNEEEKELCSEVRLIPQAYVDFANLLTTECRKHGFLRLAQARTLIKIDVNKTRRIYDFLISQGQINKDPM